MAMVASKAAEGLSGRYVPEEDASVAAAAGECGVVGRDGYVEDFVAVSGVGLD